LKEIEEETKIIEFHANPLPSFNQKMPKKRVIPVTSVKPFHLKSDERGEAYQEALKQKVKVKTQLVTGCSFIVKLESLHSNY
jgi:hypothetical protein